MLYDDEQPDDVADVYEIRRGWREMDEVKERAVRLLAWAEALVQIEELEFFEPRDWGGPSGRPMRPIRTSPPLYDQHDDRP